ncbi:hypothetical protein CC1G_14915 [Coprinopsis cinerea okayama7|uniref:Uncharacterized protein n=1 Tax=Coprinopsis cinerea (strain Okayama-7 / 130 / ATCC MYA-4618 / FGSC 9003) TaxID=240176 RepID=D6RNS7_COPC7|nr:hypothetical protein CC1G_14915 [Coprinopsis cinerea okayama7\|eukprot:XP_002910937.1 hypothetical protein CC1G_14915 [Coprinopsis cinerea okayama7\
MPARRRRRRTARLGSNVGQLVSNGASNDSVSEGEGEERVDKGVQREWKRFGKESEGLEQTVRRRI